VTVERLERAMGIARVGRVAISDIRVTN
jgi:hypothetical protein